VDWGGWAVFGVIATSLLTGVLIMAQLAGLTRLDLPLMLGVLFVADPDRARAVGFVVHLAFGQVFAFGYAASFALLDTATWWLGGLLGAAHALVAGTVLVPLLPGVHPRMALERAGPGEGRVLEPPGLLALNYGVSSPAVAVVAHVAYGALLGILLSPG
jgi:hypothetical protein